MSAPLLFEPIAIRDVTLKNRVVVLCPDAETAQRFRPGMNASSHKPRSPTVPQPRRSTLVDSMNTRPAPPAA